MRSFSLLQESIIPYIPSVITQLTQKLLAVSKVKNGACEQNVHVFSFLEQSYKDSYKLCFCAVKILHVVQYFDQNM